MGKYFAAEYPGPAFQLFGTGHLIALAMLAAVVAFLIWGWTSPSPGGRRRTRGVLLVCFLISVGSWHGWNLVHGTWTIQRHLPLHSCSLASWLCMLLLLTRNYRLYEVLYFVGIGGALQSLLTPEAGSYGLPHLRAVQTLFGHGLIVVTLVYMTSVEGLRPSWHSLWKSVLAINLYVLMVYGVNLWIGSNYMYLVHKPETASLLDYMGPWPWYILAGELLGVAVFVLLYLPFAWHERSTRRQASG